MKITDLSGNVMLSNSIEMPYLGLGVYDASEGSETIQAIHWALEAGYRHIDTASMYHNEQSVGEAVRTSGIYREEIFVTSKVWNSDLGFQSTIDAFHKSLKRMKLDYLDLFLIHWPVPDKYAESWEALEELYEQKLVRAIGVSNFMQHHLEDLINRKGHVPMVNQVEFHPRMVRNDLLKYCKKENIQLEAWTPILKGEVNKIPEIATIARKYDKTPVQVVLRWELQKGIVTIPKSSKKERIISNADLFDFELTKEEISEIDALHTNHRSTPYPVEIEV